jgi:hypothetical protein
MEDVKKCKGCDEEKSINEFSKGRNKCKSCAMDYYREYYHTHPEYAASKRERLETVRAEIESDPVRLGLIRERRNERASKRDRKRKYNLTHDQYMAMFQQQNGLCAICGKAETLKKKSGEVRSLAVDHCHVTNKVRGLLCFMCNTKLKGLEDEGFRKAASAYLAYYQQFAD